MNALRLIFLGILLFSQIAFSQNEDMRKIRSPFVTGHTLNIVGPIDSHIYDYISYMGKGIEKIEKISLKSFGGSHYWAIEIAKKIQSLKLNTEIQKGSFCASACVYLFGAGEERSIHETAWIGIHGARLAGSYKLLFHQKCQQILDQKNLKNLSLDCADFLLKMESLSLESTVDGFELMEKSGVFKSLQTYYFSLEDDEKWYEHYNVLRKPDWLVFPETALEHSLATDIIKDEQ